LGGWRSDGNLFALREEVPALGDQAFLDEYGIRSAELLGH